MIDNRRKQSFGTSHYTYFTIFQKNYETIEINKHKQPKLSDIQLYSDSNYRIFNPKRPQKSEINSYTHKHFKSRRLIPAFLYPGNTGKNSK